MTTPHTLAAEATMYLPRRTLSNFLRGVAGRKLRTYPTHVVADAVVLAADCPELAVKPDTMGRPQAVFTWPGTVGGTTARLSVRERGADRPVKAAEVHRFPVTEAVADGRITPNDARRVLAGELTLAEALESRLALQLDGEGMLDLPPVDLRSMADVDDAGRFTRAVVARLFEVPLHMLDPDHGMGTLAELDRSDTAAMRYTVGALFAEGAMASPLPGDPPAPTQSTCVLHDLRYIADQLETAQAQVALTPGGADEGSVDNAAHVALCAVQLVQAKLDVAAAGLDAARALLAINHPVGAPAPSVNLARSILRRVAEALPHHTPESTHGPA